MNILLEANKSRDKTVDEISELTIGDAPITLSVPPTEEGRNLVDREWITKAGQEESLI